MRELIPVHPDYVNIKASSEGISYSISTREGIKEFSQDDIFHHIETSDDGIQGRSVIEIAFEAFELASEYIDHNSAIFRNDSRPMGVLQSPNNPLKDKEQTERLRESWEKVHRGAHNSGRVAVLPFGIEFKPISMTARDAQLLELMSFSSIDQIAMMFDVPPYRIQDLEEPLFQM